MLQYLSAAAFSSFGKLLEPQEVSLAEKRYLQAEEPLQYVSCRKTVKVGPGENMAVLLLPQASGVITNFYLDKPVALKPHTPFAVLPIDNQCSVLL